MVESDPTRPVTASVNGDLDGERGTGGSYAAVAAYLEFRASQRMSVTLGPSVSRNVNPWQFVSNRAVGAETQYVRGRLDQRTASLTLRASYTFTPTLSLQLYAQPFVSAGSYGQFTRVADPLAAAYADRIVPFAVAPTRDESTGAYSIDADGDGVTDFTFTDPNFTFRELRSNAVLRWEYRPGSTLFVVWGQARTLADDSGRFRPGADLRDLLGAEGTNVLTVKLSYWIGR
jgi:hypothetical protein